MAPQEPPKSPEKPDEGVVKAPVEAGGDKLPEGAVFSDISSPQAKPVVATGPGGPPPSAPVQPAASNPAPKPAELPKSELPAKLAEPTPKPSAASEPKASTTPVAPRKPKSAASDDPKPTVAITVAVACFLLLVGLAVLAYSSSK